MGKFTEKPEELTEKISEFSEDEILVICVNAKTEHSLETCFRLLPKQFKNSDFYLKMVKAKGSLLFFVPQEYITEEIIVSAITNDGAALKFLNKEEQTPELCLMALNQSNKAYKNVKITKNPDHLTTINNLKKIIADKNRLIIKNTIKDLNYESL